MKRTWYDHKTTYGQIKMKAEGGDLMHAERAALLSRPMEHVGPAGQGDLPTKNASNATPMNIELLHATITFSILKQSPRKLGKQHETAKSNRKQNWLSTCGARFSCDDLHLMLEEKHKHIQDAKDRERMISQEFWDFVMDDYVL
jgi:hypothetical protein